MRWFLRMSRWARNPPSQKKARMVAIIFLICLAIWAIEYMGLWPDWATAQRALR